MNKQTKIAIIIFAVLVLIPAGYFCYVKYFSQKSPASQIPDNNQLLPAVNYSTSTPKQNPSGINNILPGFKVYKNSDFGFEIQCPDSWTVSEEDIVNVRGENTKGFFFKKPNSDLRFAILPRDGLSYGLPNNGTSSQVFIGGSPGAQSKWTLPDGKRLWLLHPQYGLYGWSEDIGRIDILSSAADPASDTKIFEEMLNSFKLSK